MRTLKYILLPILGAVAAIIAFRLAAPYEWTLTRSNLGEDDPRALFTYGTRWGDINRIAFGALLCGPFAVVLSLGRRSVLRVVLAGLIGAVLGGFVNFITDSSADLIGLLLASRSAQFGSLMAMFAWCFLVPMGVAFTLVVSQGVTPQRIRRALYAVKITAVASLGVQLIGGMVAAQNGGEPDLQAQIPVWRLVEIAVGVAFGVTMIIADEYVRVGTIRLIHGRNEYVDWSLDYTVSRIGSAEGCEIYIRGMNGVEPVHALIVQQAGLFILDAKSQTLVNGRAMTQVALNSGDEISVGDAKLVFSLGVPSHWSQIPFMSQPQPQYPTPVPSPLTLSASPLPSQPIYMPAAPQQATILQDAFGQQISLPPGRYSIGRDKTNALCLYNDPQVSPSHAEIFVTPTTVTIVDNGSATGTRVNGAPVSHPVALHPGDTLEFGASRFTYVR